MRLYRLKETDDPGPVLRLIREAFAPMAGRIDPPSSAERLDAAAVISQLRAGEVWATGDPAVACVFLTPEADALYLGKLAVKLAERGRGLGHRLLALSEARARTLGFGRITLKVRVELVENHAYFRRAGFRQVGESAHPGFERATTLHFAKDVAA